MKTFKKEQEQLEKLVIDKNTPKKKKFGKEYPKIDGVEGTVQEAKKIEKLVDLKMDLELLQMDKRAAVFAGESTSGIENEITDKNKDIFNYRHESNLGRDKYENEVTEISKERFAELREDFKSRNNGKKPSVKDMEKAIQNRLKTRKEYKSPEANLDRFKNMIISDVSRLTSPRTATKNVAVQENKLNRSRSGKRSIKN